ncbi:hypothetical protein ACRE_007680 [Hapsidospora chrysogenum ATCC 11550]|uniref:C2H2-type domain-containing protein n=1 Tax=Hapsidospora chrysogenum (strain ATCC 11550 / CBS 779.69 / DSM 880 / IAM 14645 / JCM 23072 / IMI 49137) TaxID=857340 RepID=A0A086TG86_HAPC1|nr:hypothetical protein ACRE_007680 [Hapsidospora chrysogenum ATCC 11550]
MQPSSGKASRVRSPASPSRSRFSVVIAAPKHVPDETHVTSDVTPRRGRPVSRPVKQTPVPLPVIPGMPRLHQHDAASSRPPAPKQTPVPLPRRPAVAAASTPAAAKTTTTPPTAPSASRGRPKGWKPGMSYAAMRGNPPPGARASRPARPKFGQGQAGIVKRRGRPPKQPSPPPEELYRRLEAPFVEFLCEWRDCKAELQNLETLRKHVCVVHVGDQKHPPRCRWGKCGRGDKNPGVEFPGIAGLEAHVERAHMEPFAWHVGDGPVNTSGRGGYGKKRDGGDDGEIPDYLKDADGNQVTPSVRDQEVEDYVTWRNNRRKLKELLLERDRNLPSEDETDESKD